MFPVKTMTTYLVLIRGINVGGKNIVPMTELRSFLQELDFSNVTTYIASGNVILQSDLSANEVQTRIERTLPERCRLDSKLVRVLVLTHDQLLAVVDGKPKGFGDQPGTYHSDVIFLMGINPAEAMPVFDPREGVDEIWPGKLVIYSQRLSSLRTKSRLSKIVGTQAYQSMTIRTWNTTTKLLAIMENANYQ